MSFDPNAIGNRIFTLRTNAKLSQEKLAEKLGVSHRHLGDLERGSYPMLHPYKNKMQ